MYDNLNKEITRISQAYLFTELYRKGFLKSKSLTFSDYTHDLLLKLHHIIKTSAKKEIEKSFTDIFSNLKFSSYSGLKISFILDNQYGKMNIFTTRVNNIIQNARIGLSSVMLLSINGSSLIYKFDNFNYLVSPLSFGGIMKKEFDLKSNLDSVVNCIMYLPTSVRLIGDLIKEINKIDDQYDFTLNDMIDYLFSIQSGSSAFIELKDTIVKNINNYCEDNIDKLNEIINIPIENRAQMYMIRPHIYNYDINFLTYLVTKTGELNGRNN